MNPNMEYSPYNMIELMADPPAMWLFGVEGHTYGKYFEALALARHMSGSLQNIEVDKFLMKMTLMMQGEDGLLYVPTAGRPWFLENTWYLAPDPEKYGKVPYYCTLGYGTSWHLGGLGLHAQMLPGGPWNDAAQKLADAIRMVHVVEGDTASL